MGKMKFHTTIARPGGRLLSSMQMTTTKNYHKQVCYIKFCKHKRRRTYHWLGLSSILFTVIIMLFALFNQTITTSLAIHVEQRCQPTYSFFCNIPNYSTVLPFNNTLGHTTLEDATSALHKYGFLQSMPHCEKKVQLFLCSLYFPVCVIPSDITTKPLLPCRDICEEAYQCEPQIREAMNTSWPPEWDCDKFGKYSESHKLCVIDNQKEAEYKQTSDLQPTTNSGYPVNRNTIPPVAPPTPPIDAQDDAACGHGLFDCRSSDPKRPLCIDMRFVCDGKTDCYQNDSYDLNVGLDEMNCTDRCGEGQLNCDDKCIGRFDICNGKVDCSSGVDEQDCIDGLIGITQLVLCVFVMLSAVYILVRFFKVDLDRGNKEQPCENPYDSHDDNIAHSPSLIDTRIAVINPESQPCKPLPPKPHMEEMLHACREPMYQEPSILTRSDAYERILPGGYSGASSVYDFHGSCSVDNLHIMSSVSMEEPKKIPSGPPPPGPPPSPILPYYHYANTID